MLDQCKSSEANGTTICIQKVNREPREGTQSYKAFREPSKPSRTINVEDSAEEIRECGRRMESRLALLSEDRGHHEKGFTAVSNS